MLVMVIQVSLTLPVYYLVLKDQAREAGSTFDVLRSTLISQAVFFVL
jgi:hypothetical protein